MYLSPLSGNQTKHQSVIPPPTQSDERELPLQNSRASPGPSGNQLPITKKNIVRKTGISFIPGNSGSTKDQSNYNNMTV